MKYRLTPFKEGMRYSTKHGEQQTIEDVQKAIGILLGRGFTYITIQEIQEPKP